MRKHFETELNEMHNDILRMGSLVERQLYLSIEALVNQDTMKSNEIIKNDDLVDQMQKEIEEKCIKLIAMQQPLAIDLRNIFTSIKIVTDLERMADHAVDIAKIEKKLIGEKYIKELVDIPKIADIVKVMIKKALDAYVESSVEKAYIVCKMDDEVDAIYKEVVKELFSSMNDNPENINQATQFLFVAKYLERIGDHVTNICEAIVYFATGEIVDLND